MATLDAGRVRGQLDSATRQRLDVLEAFDEIESTNSYLMQQPRPQRGFVRVAATMNQTAGRGRYGKRWVSPPGSGLCLSIAYTFLQEPDTLPALTLAIGISAIAALQATDINGVMLKWPNDLVLNDGKLGGILTEAHAHGGKATSIVTGIGINVEMTDKLEREIGPRRDLPAAALRSLAVQLPSREELTARLIDSMYAAFVEYEACGFSPFLRRWRAHDWLRGRSILVEAGQRQVAGTAAGVDENGALLLDLDNGKRLRVASGSVMTATSVANTP